MKRELRISGLKDYIAVDIVDDKGVIISTPFYLKFGEKKELKYKDNGKSYRTTVLINKDFTGLKCFDKVEEFEFDIEFGELTENHINFYE